MAARRALVRVLGCPSPAYDSFAPRSRGLQAGHQIDLRTIHTIAQKLRRGWTVPTVTQKLDELLGRNLPDQTALVVQESQANLATEKYADVPPEQRGKLQRAELKNMIKEQIKTKIKTRLKKERDDYYARLPRTEEERIEQRINRAEKMIAFKRLQLRKYIMDEPPPAADDHDPEVLTAEQLHYLKKIGQRYKNYCPVGKRGVYGGTVENMHMHWKRHQTVRIDCHMFSMEETRKISEELARLSGGIVVDILWDKTIIMYRGRNYEQPKKLIPENTLNKRNALKKSLLEQSIKSREAHVSALQRNLKQLREQRTYEMQKNQLALEQQQPNPLISLPVKKRRPLFSDVGQAYDFEDDSDPCSETGEDDDEDEEEAEGEAEAFSGEEDQRSLLDEEDRKDMEVIKAKRRLWNHRRIFTPQVRKYERMQRRIRPRR